MALLLSFAAQASAPPDIRSSRDLFYREVLFQLYSEDYLDAITHLLAAEERGPLPRDTATDLVKVGIELSYGLHENALDTLRTSLDSRIDAATRDRVWLSLARLWLCRGYVDRAADALGRMTDRPAEELAAERAALQAEILMNRGDSAGAAATLAAAPSAPGWTAYARYNQAVALGRLGKDRAAAEILLSTLARSEDQDGEQRFVRDRAAVALGVRLIEDGNLGEAEMMLARVAPDSPLYTQARMGIGRIRFERGDPKQAAAIWTDVRDRGGADPATRDALLMLPYAAWRDGDFAGAAAGYGTAITALDHERFELDSTAAAIRADASLASLVAADSDSRPGAGFLPDIYASPYLAELVSSDRFTEAWHAYRNLRFLRRRLDSWWTDMSVFEAMIATRREAYDERLPRVIDRLRALDLASLRGRAEGYAGTLEKIERTDDAFGLATARERELTDELEALEHRTQSLPASPEAAALATRIRVLKGLVRWNVEETYKIRLWDARRDIWILTDSLAAAAERRAALERAQRGSPRSFQGFDVRIAALRSRIAALRERLAQSIAAHERYLQTLAIAALEDQARRVDAYRVRARFHLARLLDDTSVAGAERELTAVRRRALEAWQDYAAMAGDGEGGMEAMRRIADLQLAISEDAMPGSAERDAGFAASIAGYHQLLERYPEYPRPDDVYYQLARAHDDAGQGGQSIETLTVLVSKYPQSRHYFEAQFRRGETLFAQNDYAGAEAAYRAVLAGGAASPFHQQALYKHGWCEFKAARFTAALDDFTAVLSAQLLPSGETGGVIEPDSLPRAQRELADDALRAISLSFDHLEGPRSVSAYLAHHGGLPYDHLIYATLADLYLDRGRYADAAQAFAAFVEHRPNSEQAPMFQIRVFETYDQAGLGDQELAEKREFLTRYGPKSAFWKDHEMARMPAVERRLKQELLAMAQRAHAEAQHSRRDADYAAAAQWYREYLDGFPADDRNPSLSFLLGDLLFENGRYDEAIASYERSAYEYGPHPQAAAAGYAALLGYERLVERTSGGQRDAWRDRAIASALRFADRFPDHEQTAAVVGKAAQQLFEAKRFDDAAAAAGRVIALPAADPAQRLGAWMIIGTVRFDAGAYAEAEAAYAEAMKLAAAANTQTRSALAERLAASIYKQGEASLAGGDAAAAAGIFLRVAATVPHAAIAETAEYDAAAALMSVSDWDGAITVLERFRQRYPDSRWQAEATRKLALAYLESGRLPLAADEFARIGRETADTAVARDAAWRSAELYARTGDITRTIGALEGYVTRFPQPMDRAMEARWRLAETQRTLGDDSRRQYWLREIVDADERAGAARTDFSRETAAKAALALADPLRETFARAQVKIPLDKSLKAKKQAMEKAIGALRKAAGYGVGSVTTAATFRIAELYHDFGRALLESQRPPGLSAEEREQYDVLLEEQAYPFEEESIKLHEINFKRIAQGFYDEWVRASMDQLAVLVPARYGKSEKEVPYVDSLW